MNIVSKSHTNIPIWISSATR